MVCHSLAIVRDGAIDTALYLNEAAAREALLTALMEDLLADEEHLTRIEKRLRDASESHADLCDALGAMREVTMDEDINVDFDIVEHDHPWVFPDPTALNKRLESITQLLRQYIHPDEQSFMYEYFIDWLDAKPGAATALELKAAEVIAAHLADPVGEGLQEELTEMERMLPPALWVNEDREES